MRYHINYDGKILPCRAKIKNCPYGPARHADSYEDLYYKYQDTYNNVNPSPTMIEKLKRGDPLNGLQDFDNEIAKSDSPVELICSTLKTAISNAGAGSLTKKEQEYRKETVRICTDFMKGGRELPAGIPYTIRHEAELAAGKFSISALFDTNKYYKATNGMFDGLKADIPNMEKIEQKRNSGFQFTPEQKNIYVNKLKHDFNYWEDRLNTRKLLAQPMLVTSNDDELQANLQKMNNEELLSLYDSCTVSDKEIINRLVRVKDFNYTEIPDLSEEANKKLQLWHQSANNAERHYIVGSARRTLIALYTANILVERKVNFGDYIYSYNEHIPEVEAKPAENRK